VRRLQKVSSAESIPQEGVDECNHSEPPQIEAFGDNGECLTELLLDISARLKLAANCPAQNDTGKIAPDACLPS